MFYVCKLQLFPFNYPAVADAFSAILTSDGVPRDWLARTLFNSSLISLRWQNAVFLGIDPTPLAHIYCIKTLGILIVPIQRSTT